MDTERMIRELRRLENKHKNDFVGFGQNNWSDMCHDVANRLEELSKREREEDILKFYHCESEDKYLIGQRLDTMYYAEYDGKDWHWCWSRYLPWGTDGYPSEPKEIPFTSWLDGFLKKHGWKLN